MSLTETLVDKSVVLISMLIEQFVVCNQVEGKSPRTVKWYRDILGQFVVFLEEHGYPVDLRSFTLTRVREYINRYYVLRVDRLQPGIISFFQRIIMAKA